MSGAHPPPPDGLSDAVLEAASHARIGVGVTVLEPTGMRNVWFNEPAIQLLGRPLEELMAGSSLAFIAPEEIPRMLEMVRARESGEVADSSFETAIVRPDGARVPVQVAISTLVVRGQPTAVWFMVDIRARRQTESALRRSEARFRSLIESAPDAIAMMRGGRILFANRASVELLGLASIDEISEVRLDTVISGEEHRAMLERVRAMLDHGQRFAPREYRARRRDGRQLVVEVTSHVIEYEGAPAVVAFGRDVTERARLQEQLARADRLAALGTLAAGVAHEINNPLAFVTLGIDSLEADIARAVPDSTLRADLLARLEPLRRGAARVGEIVRDLRAFSRGDEEAPRAIDVAAVIQAAERLAAHELRRRAQVRIDVEGAPWSHGHAGRLEQVLVNLLVNAAQSFEERRDEARVDVRCATRGDRVVIEVEDNGPGIAPEPLGRVFDPFFTTKPSGVGTGLGLSICHSIVTRMGGTIAIDSVLGRGTTARVELPAWCGELPSCADVPRAPAAARTRLRVLVVDDEPALGRMLHAILSCDHEVVLAADGVEALEHIDAAAFDVVLCDVSMPRMGGRELQARLAAKHPELAGRFVFMTGGAIDPATDRWLETMDQPRLWKPFAVERLHEALRRVAGARPEAARAPSSEASSVS